MTMTFSFSFLPAATVGLGAGGAAAVVVGEASRGKLLAEEPDLLLADLLRMKKLSVESLL